MKTLAIGLLICWFSVFAGAQAPMRPGIRDAGALRPHQPVERELGPLQGDMFGLQVAAGKFVHIEIRQIDASASDTEIGFKVESPGAGAAVGAAGFSVPPRFSWIAKSGGLYKIKVAKIATSKNGRYRIEVTDLHDPTLKDQTRITAEAKFLEATLKHYMGPRGNQNPAAIPLYVAAASQWRGIDERYEALCHDRIALIHSAQGEWRAELESLNKAVDLYRASKDRAGEAAILARAGVAYGRVDDFPRMLESANQALPIFRTLGNLAAEITTLAEISGAYSGLGDYEKALTFSSQGVAVSRAAGNRLAELAALTALGFVNYNLGDRERAVDAFNQGLTISRALNNVGMEANLYSLIGATYSQGNATKALEAFEKGMTLADRSNDARLKAMIAAMSAQVYAKQGDKQKALALANQALGLAGQFQGSPSALLFLAGVYGTAGDTAKALVLFVQVLPVANAIGNPRIRADFFGGLRDVFGPLQPEIAIFFGKQAVNILQTLRRENPGLGTDVLRTFEASIESHYRSLARLLVARQRFGEAEEVLNLLKEKEARDFSRRDGITDQLKPATLLASEKQALDRYEQISGQITTLGRQKAAILAKASKAALTPAEKEESARVDNDLKAANIVLLRYFGELEKSFGASSAAARRTEEFREAAGVQSALRKLGPDVVAIYTLVAPDRYVAMLITGGARKAYTTSIPEKELNAKIFEFRQALQNPGSEPLPLAKELYGIVFPEGLRRDLDAAGAKTIMWSVDGSLRYIPMAALHDGKDYLVKRYRNSLITPASLTRLTDGPQSAWQGVGFGVSEAKAGFDSLPAVAGELRGIFPAPVPGTVRLNATFTREAFQNDLRQPNKRVVHIASHFVSRPGVAANSRLLMGDGTELSLAEIEASEQLFDGVDLLTLSACSTAFTNRNEDGREVDSFGAIAQRLGARGVIASLWNVNDDATARLMQAMYRLRQQEPAMGKNEALRRAQERLADGTIRQAAGNGVGWTHPFFWAPFVLIGNWR